MKSPAPAGPLLVVSFTGNSGLTDYSVSFCREAQRTYPTVLATADSIEPIFREMGFPVETVFRRSRHYPIDVIKFIRLVMAMKPTLVLFQGPLKFPLLDAVAVRWLRRRGIAVAVVVHDVVPHHEGRWGTFALHHYYRVFPKLITHSLEAKERIQSAGVRGAMLTIPHGRYDIFDVDGLTRDEARTALGIEADKTVALFFGNLEERKGLRAVVEAARENEDPSLMFLAAGQDFLSAQADDDLRTAVRTPGSVPGLRVDVGRVPHRSVQNYFRASDVVLLPYLEGTTSGVLKLAMAFGVPVLATNVGDVGEQLREGGGLLLESVPSGQSVLVGITEITRRSWDAAEDPSVAWNAIAPKVLAFLLPGR